MGQVMQAGDIGFAHSDGIIGKAIRLGEAMRGSKNDARWNHAFVLYKMTDDGTDWYIIQAEAKGVTCDKLLSQVAGLTGHYEIIPLDSRTDRASLLSFAHSQVGSKYGYVSIASCVFDILLPDSICLRKSGTWICSGLVMAALTYGTTPGISEYVKKDIYTTTPAEAYHFLTC